MLKLITLASAATLLALVACSSQAPPTTAQNPPADPSLIQRGAYVAKLGDCAACHTASHGSAYGGGLKIDSPIGAIYSTNITPDIKTGIGSYSYADFSNALRKGVRQDGATLYPAMPYPEFSRMTDDDTRALYAYFMHGVQPVAAADKAEGISWPLSMRWPLRIWRAMFAPQPKPYLAPPGADAQIARGEYLVTGPGHCGACHTARGIAMQEKALDARGGAVFLGGGAPMDNWLPSSLRDDPRTGLGRWSEDDIVAFLKNGRTDHAAAFGGMVDVVAWSTSQFKDEDLHAMAKYLKSLPSVPAEPGVQNGGSQASLARGSMIYAQQCSLCHQVDGKGVPRMFPPLAGDPILASHDPTSLMNIVLNGAVLPPNTVAPSAVEMPAYRDKLSDAQIADVVNYVRSHWGNQAPSNATEAAVAGLRKHAAGSNTLGWIVFNPQPYGQGWTFAPESHGAGDAPH